MIKRLLKKLWRRKFKSDQASVPYFLIIGVQKGGTTSLYNYLQQHLQIQESLTKEVHFFDLNFDKGWDWYLEQLRAKELINSNGKKVITGEASPYYIFHPLVPERVFECVPNVKLIVLLRDPVARALSQYHHECRWGFESLELGDAIDIENERLEGEADKFIENSNYQSYGYQHHSYVKRGFYLKQLLCWEKYFSSENILVIQSEFFDKYSASVLGRVTDFLGLDEFQFLSELRHNSGKYPESADALKFRLADEFFEANQQLLSHLEKQYPANNLIGFAPGEVNWLTPRSV
ncbi:MAG: sulfotransferase domain-containing protein [Cyanobacteria bacterium P01_C01_bin.89]